MYNYKESVNQKIIIMEGFVHNIEHGISKSRKMSDFYAPNFIVNPYICALIFELSIKSMWELSHSKSFGDSGEIRKYGHNIKDIYKDLNTDFQQNILRLYNEEVDNIKPMVVAYGSQHCCFLTLDECLTENKNIVMNAKYRFIPGSKINVVTCTIPSNGELKMSGQQPPLFLKHLISIIKNELNNV